MDEDSRVGLVGGDASVATAVRDAGGSPVSGDPRDVLAADPTVVVAVGQSALLALVRHRPETPVLPVDAGPGVGSIPGDVLTDAIARVSLDAPTTTHPLLAVEVGGERAGLACLDATLVAGEPARISAFEVNAAGESRGTIRADGVVVATPAGSSGYAARLDAPTLAPETGVVAVEPIAQFTTAPDRWVLPDEEVTVTVERDEVPVEVLADDRVVGRARSDEPVTVARDGTFETVVVPDDARSAGGGGELEKH